MKIKSRIKALHLKLYQENERRLKELITSPRRYAKADIERYERELFESIPEGFEDISIKELKGAIRKAKIILVGDYHTLAQSQKGFLRILKTIRSSKIVIGLEFVMASHQAYIDQYLEDRIDEKRFLKRIRYEQSWPSYKVWPSFKEIFTYAKRKGFKILALDCEPFVCSSVFSRASFMAWRIAETLRENPSFRIVALIGEAHLAPDHLPAILRDALRKMNNEVEILIIHQMLDPLWFTIVERGLEDREAFSIGEGRFYVPVSSPIVAQQSFIRMVSGEETLERGTLKQEFAKYLRELGRIFGLRSSGLLRELEVCSPMEIAEMKDVMGKMNEDEFAMILDKVTSGEPVSLPEYNLVIISRPIPTYIAEASAIFLKQKLSSSHTPSNPVDFFYSRILYEVIAFFASKIFNPKRKTPSKTHLTQKDDIDPSCDIAIKIALWHKRNQWQRWFSISSFDNFLRRHYFEDGLSQLDPDMLRPIIKIIGDDLGERIYVGFMKERISTSKVRHLFIADFDAQGRAFGIFKHLIEDLKAIKVPKRL